MNDLWNWSWQVLGSNAPDLDRLKAMYRRRPYHNWGHVGYCLDKLQNLYAGSDENKAMMALALFYHDVVYLPGSADNEAESARAFEIDGANLSGEHRGGIVAMILATGPKTPETYEEKLVRDIDWSILLEAPEAYETYAKSIRQEFSGVGDAYCEGRKAFLRGLYEGESPFYFIADSAKLDSMYDNILWELGYLERTR